MVEYTDKQYDMIEALYDMIKSATTSDNKSERYEYAWKRQISNLLFDIKSNGYPTGLVTRKALETDKPYYVKDHVYSRGTVAEYLIDTYRTEPFDMEWLRNNFPRLTTSIFVTQEENILLGQIAKEMSLGELFEMEHYKTAGIELLEVPSHRVKRFSHLITHHMEQLIMS